MRVTFGQRTQQLAQVRDRDQAGNTSAGKGRSLRRLVTAFVDGKRLEDFAVE